MTPDAALAALRWHSSDDPGAFLGGFKATGVVRADRFAEVVAALLAVAEGVGDGDQISLYAVLAVLRMDRMLRAWAAPSPDPNIVRAQVSRAEAERAVACAAFVSDALYHLARGVEVPFLFAALWEHVARLGEVEHFTCLGPALAGYLGDLLASGPEAVAAAADDEIKGVAVLLTGLRAAGDISPVQAAPAAVEGLPADVRGLVEKLTRPAAG